MSCDMAVHDISVKEYYTDLAECDLARPVIEQEWLEDAKGKNYSLRAICTTRSIEDIVHSIQAGEHLT